MERERLTITLRRDILKLVDQAIDGAKLRNRSHAIEYFLTQSLSPKKVRVVLVLSRQSPPTFQAGRIPIGIAETTAQSAISPAKSILAMLSEQNFKDILIAADDPTLAQAASVDAAESDLEAKTAALRPDGVPADTAIDQLSQQLQDETFILWDGRFAGHLDLSAFLDFHRNTRGTATAALSQSREANPTGLLAQLYGSRVVGVNKSDQNVSSEGLPLAGVFAFESQILNSAQSDQPRHLFEEILPELIRDQKLSGFVFTAKMSKEQPVPARAAR